MSDPRLRQLTDAWLEGRLLPEETEELNQRLRTSEEARAYFRSETRMHGLLHCAAAADVVEAAAGGARALRPGVGWARPQRWAAAVLLGVVLGACGASLAWALALPATTSVAIPLADGSFEEQAGPVAHGFPTDVGRWGGDASEVITDPALSAQGRRSLRFLRAEAEANEPGGAADWCDVYQIVDLRPFQPASNQAVLELSARFRNESRTDPEPFVAGCYLYLFQGRPEALRGSWPAVLRQALSLTGTRSVLPPESAGPMWRVVTTRALLPSSADFAVIHLSVGRSRPAGSGPLELGAQYVDDVVLTLREPKCPRSAKPPTE